MNAFRFIALFLTVFVAPAFAQQPARDFYRGKTMSIIVPFTPGGYYDLEIGRAHV